LIAVIRYHDERTLDRCAQVVEKQFGTACIVQVAPFYLAVRECFRIAQESTADWLITVDADVILADDYRNRLEREIVRTETHEWQILGTMDCKLSGSVRQGGARAWRVSALANMQVRDVRRPESDLCHRYGNWRYVDDWITGRHGYDQSPRYYHRAGRNPKWRNRKQWHEYWRQSNDPDLAIALRGLRGLPL